MIGKLKNNAEALEGSAEPLWLSCRVTTIFSRGGAMAFQAQSVREYPAIPTMASGIRMINKTRNDMIVKAALERAINVSDTTRLV